MLKFLLSLDEVPLEGGKLGFNLVPPAELVLLTLCVAALLSWFSYRNLRKTHSRTSRIILVLLRTLTFCLVFACILGPRWTAPKATVNLPMLAVLVDDSASMDRLDSNYTREQLKQLAYAAGLSNSPASEPHSAIIKKIESMSRLELIRSILSNEKLAFAKNLEGKFTLNFFSFSKKLFAQNEDVPQDVHEATGIGSAIREAVSRLAGQRLAGIVVFTDGGHNFGPHPVPAARFAAGQGVGVYVIGIGGLLEPRDIGIEPVDYKEVIFKGDKAEIATTVFSSGYEGKRVPVVLTVDGKEVDKKTVTLGKDGDPVSVSFQVKIDNAGEYRFSISIPIQGKEAVRENNERTFSLRVIEDRIKVLFVAGAPTWEYRFLKNALMRDPTMETTVLLQRGEGGWFYEGNHPTKRFPSDIEGMLKFDVVIFEDIAVRGFLSESNLESLEKFVSEAGGGLIYIAGEKNGLPPLSGSVLQKLLPVRISPLPIISGGTTEFRPVKAIQGVRHPAYRFSADEEENHRLWNSLPGFFWFYPVYGVKPGAEVLLEHPHRRVDGQPAPLAVQAYYGSGRVYFSAVDSTWRWRREVGDRYFYRFWGQLIRFCAQERLLGGGRRLTLSTELPEYRPGSMVRIIARAFNRELKPLEESQIECEARLPGGGVQVVILKKDEVRPSVFRGEMRPVVPGRYTLKLQVDNVSAERAFTVKYVSPEQSTLMLDEDLLRIVASESGGVYISPAELGSLADIVGTGPSASVEYRYESLLDAPLVFLLFVILLGAEWITRRLLRLM